MKHTDQSKYLLLFTTLILISFTCFNLFLRTGFKNTLLWECFILSGLSLFIVYFPFLLIKYSNRGDLWFLNQPLWQVFVVIFLCLLGFLGVPTVVSFFIASLGFIALSLSFFKTSKAKFSAFFFSLLMLAFFSLWIVSVTWGGFHLRPAFMETLVVTKPYFFDQGYNNADTLYHLSIAQMIKHYGVASTGLDGIPNVYYHYGSHWVMAQLSSFTGIHLVHLYNLGYPLIFITLFFNVFLQFVFRVQEWLFKKTDTGLLFTLLLLCIYIGVPRHLYAGGLLGHSGLVNESFTISLTVLFVFLHTAMAFWQSGAKHGYLFIILTIFLVIAAGIIKISTGFVLTALIGYLFLRFGLYRKLSYWLCVLLPLVGFLFTYFLTAEILPFGIRKMGIDEGFQQYLHFYRHTHAFEPISWFGGFYLWLYTTSILIFALPSPADQTKVKYLWNTRMTLPAETSIVIALVGVVPSLVMAFIGTNSMYFSGIQLFVSGAFVLAFVPLLTDKIQAWLAAVKVPLRLAIQFVLVVGLLLLMYVEVRWHFNKMIKVNVQMRREILNIPVDPQWRVKYDHSTFGIFSEPVQQAYDTIKFGRFLSSLMEQEKDVNPSKLLFLNHQTLSTDFFRNIRCIETPFIAPAFSGHAMLDGLSYKCEIGMYGYSYYQRNFAGVPHPSQSQICDKTVSKGFAQVMIFNEAKSNFLLLECTPALKK
jgi:hypothetical protein